MPVMLPDLPLSVEPVIREISRSRDLVPAGAGDEQRINRIGTKHEIDFSVPALDASACGPAFIAKLARGRTEGAVIRIPEPKLPNRDYGVPLVATAGWLGSDLPIKGLVPGVVIPEGKWLSVIINGRRYAYFTTAEITASPTGTATLLIYPMIRRSAPLNAVVELTAPKIEGFVQQPVERTVRSIGAIGFNFTIRERG